MSGFRVPPDQQARLDATRPDVSHIVQAPAGSGKTELLTQRFLRLLSTVDQPEEIVAITFTRKAAGEMVDRIVSALRAAETQPEPSEPHKRATWVLARAALDRSTERGWDLAATSGRLRVTTIDSLCASIVRALPTASGLGGAPGISEDSDELFREAARLVLAKLDAPLPVADSLVFLLQRIQNRVSGDMGTSAESLIMDMLRARDQWLRYLPADGDEEKLRRDLEASLGEFVRQGLVAVRGAVPPQLAERIIALAAFAGKNVPDESSPIAVLNGLTQLPGSDPADAPLWCGIAHLFLTKSDAAWRKAPRASEGFLAPSEAKDAAAKASRKAMKEEHSALVADLAAAGFTPGQLHAVRLLPPAAYGEHWETIVHLFRVLAEASRCLQEVFAARGEVDFAEIAARARAALEATPDPGAVFQPPVRHLLVDEFQDTSYGQFALFEKMTAGWGAAASAGGGAPRTVFLVGDPMQSIYRFREAEVSLYLHAWHTRRLGDVPLEPLSLTANFRSQPAVVEWVNTTMGRVLPAKDKEDELTGAVAYSPSEAARAGDGGAGVVEVHTFAGDTAPDEQTAAAVELVQKSLAARLARDPDNPGTTAILGRNRSHVVSILTYMAVEIDPLAGRPAVEDLLSLTRALVHPADRIAWLAVLRAPWCGLTLAHLLVLTGDALARKASPDTEADTGAEQSLLRPSAGRTVWEAMNDDAVVAALDADGRERLLAVRAVLAQALDARGRLPFRRVVESAWVALGGPGVLPEATALEESREFLDLLSEIGEGSDVGDLSDITRALTSLYAPPDVAADESVQVMTIHKAKGLEFDTVIIPDMARQPRPESDRLLRWAATGYGPGGRRDVIFAPIGIRGGDKDPFTLFVASIEREKALNEAGRLLYVATTRAREELRMLAALPKARPTSGYAFGEPQAGSLLGRMWEVVKEETWERHAEALPAEIPAEDEGGDKQSETDGEPEIRNWDAGNISGNLQVTTIRRRALPLDPPAFDGDAVAPGELSSLPVQEGGAEDEGPQEPPPDPAELFSPHHASLPTREAGVVTHRQLCRIAREGVDRWDAERVRAARPAIAAALRQLGVRPADLDAAAGRVVAALEYSVTDPRGRWILGRHDAEQNEFPITGYDGGVLINNVLDRTFVADGVRWIVDYKTSSHEGGTEQEKDAYVDGRQKHYRPQLDRYARLIRRLLPDECLPVRCLLFFPLLQRERSWGEGE